MATRGKEVQDFIKENKKTAREMFEDNGWEQTKYDNKVIMYEISIGAFRYTIEFDLVCEVYIYRCGNVCEIVDMTTHKLIQYQLEELGWL